MLGPNFKVSPETDEKNYGKFIIEPLDQGFGHTLGNALRRTLLSSLEGAAITNIKINGVKHQFTVLAGLKEDIVELVLNLKKVRVQLHGEEKAAITLSVSGPREITAKDFEVPSSVEIINKDLYLASLADKKAVLELTATVEKGYGYTPSEELKVETLGVLAIDALFSPVERVNYKVEATRVGRMTNLDKLIMEIWTDGTILPLDALKEGAKILTSYFTQIFKPKIVVEKPVEDPLKSLMDDNVLKLTVEELDLPTRIANCLKNAGLETVKDLTEHPGEEISKIKNLGLKSLSLIEEKLNEKGLKLKN